MVKYNVFKFDFTNAHRYVDKTEFPVRNVLPVCWIKDAFRKICTAKSQFFLYLYDPYRCVTTMFWTTQLVNVLI
jgi:hypothetical protein